MLKLSLPAIVGTLVRLFNISLRLGEVPEEWKEAVVIPLHKGGKKPSKDPLSYRPISLTSCVARVLEKATALPSLQTRFDYHTLVMFYKIHTKQAPSYLTSLLPPLSSRSGYTFRKLSYRFPTVSRTSTLNSFLPRAVALWNALPTNVQQASSIYTFKKLLQSHLKI